MIYFSYLKKQKNIIFCKLLFISLNLSKNRMSKKKGQYIIAYNNFYKHKDI